MRPPWIAKRRAVKVYPYIHGGVYEIHGFARDMRLRHASIGDWFIFDSHKGPHQKTNKRRIINIENYHFHLSCKEELVIKQKKEKEELMKKAIIRMFPKTEDAVLVERHLGKFFNNPLREIALEGKADKVLALAKEMEAKAQENTKKGLQNDEDE